MAMNMQNSISQYTNTTSYTSAIGFYGKLAEKLKEMTQSLITQFSELTEQHSIHKGAFLAEASVKVPEVNIRYEYIIYVKRYGPPENGVFDENILDAIRKEMGF
jgi:hypothetical protein